MASTPTKDANERLISPNFITDIIERDVENGKVDTVVTRFPPEPNGYAHIGHAFASYIDFGMAQDYNGRCHLRMDDTNPEGERSEYAEALMEDMRWLGWDWGEHLYYASDYYDELYAMAVRLIREGKAYIDSLSEKEISEFRGSVTKAGRESPYRSRSVEENLELFERMRTAEFAEGEHVLRAKIDMASPNMKLRDPILYRILYQSHYRTGDKWCIYPMYDFAHPLSDAIEGITHSLCSSEFIENRAIYDWLVDNLFGSPRPYQYEFGRRSLEYTITSKRRLIELVNEGYVNGWDDPRMPTLAGLRRRGVRPSAIRDFASRIGVSKTDRTVDIALLEYAIRDDLNFDAPRVMAVSNPLKVTLTNYEGEEWLEADYFPADVGKPGSRKLPFSKTLYIEQDDFMEIPAKGFRRLSPGEYVRLRHAYIIRCDDVIKDVNGEIKELRCSYLPESRGESPPNIKVKAAIHWLSAEHAKAVTLRLYDRLFTVPNPADEENVLDFLNPNSLIVKKGFIEPSVLNDLKDTRYQFERTGYFWRDPASADEFTFNRIISLKDTWKNVRKENRVKHEPVKVASQEGEAPNPVLSFSDEQKAMLKRLKTMGVSHDDAVLIAENDKLSSYLLEAAKQHSNAKSIANWLVNDLRREMETDDPYDLKPSPSHIAELVSLVDRGAINNRIAADVFKDMLETGDSPKAIVEEKGLEQVSDEGEILPLIETLLAQNPDKVSAYKEGKTGLIGFFVGQVMRETGGKANPQLVQSLLQKALG